MKKYADRETRNDCYRNQMKKISRHIYLDASPTFLYYRSMQPIAPVLPEQPHIVLPSAQSSGNQSSVVSSIQQSSTSQRSKSQFLQIAKLSAIYAALFITPIAGAFGLTKASSLQAESKLTSPIASINQMQATLASAETAHSASIHTTADSNSIPSSEQSQGVSNSFEYEISLANGFLKKAVELSNAAGEQTVEQKDMIIQLLGQAMEASNRAIKLNPDSPDGYTSRGRIYQVTSVVKPEMKVLADQDFEKARQLGSPTPTSAPSTKNPLELLPTEQAQSTSTAMIAGPEDGKKKETVQGATEQNAKRGSVTLEAGKSEVVVPYALVKDTTQLYVTADKNPENVTIYVKNKEAGVGFTIASTSAPTAPLEITWWEIQ